MASPLQQFQNSRVWDKKYNLPLFPKHNNPHLYCAYVLRILETTNQITPQQKGQFLADYKRYFKKCEIRKGFIFRWPGRKGGATSHDEVVGAASISASMSRRLYYRLTKYKWVYNVEGKSEPWYYFGKRYWLGRFLFLKPYIRARAGRKVSGSQKSAFNLLLKIDASSVSKSNHAKGASSRLMFWLMWEKMQGYSSCKKAYKKWAKSLESKGITPRSTFKAYFSKDPVFYRNAPEKWLLD